MLLCTLILFVLCTMAAGALYFLRNSPEHRMVLYRDRNAPVAVVHDAVSANGMHYEIRDFVDSVYDQTRVEMSYVNAPDYDTDGVQNVVIRFTDEAGNYTDLSLELLVYHDISAPVISGESEIYVFRGETVSYRSLVEVTDDRDAEVALEIDNSRVDLGTVGSYVVYFTATDSSGNISQKAVTIHVIDNDSDEYYLMKANELCDLIIQQIITEDMDELHKVWAVYEYVRQIPYILTDYTRNYIREGYKMLSEYRGDCYGSYAAVRLLLDRLGIMNIPIQTDESYTKHFWNMVSLDGGFSWYHVDATNWTEWGYRPVMCMISDNRLNQISLAHRGTHRHFVEDYPATPAASMYVPADVAAAYGVDVMLDQQYYTDDPVESPLNSSRIYGY